MNTSDRSIPSNDRPTGFRRLTPVSQALRRLDELGGTAGRESVGLNLAAGRVLAADVISPIDVPSFARAAMDGFAVADTSTGARVIVGESRPGKPCDREVVAGLAVRIMTGAPVPSGTRAVVPIEQCRDLGETVEILAEAAPGRHIVRVGEDVGKGLRVLERGRVLRPQDVGLLSSLGMSLVDVVRQPMVRIITSGSELLPPGTPPVGYRIADSNSVMLNSLVARDGGLVTDSRQLPEDPEMLRREILNRDWEILLVNGGTSVGRDDHAPRVLGELAGEMIHGLDMKPGMPSGFGVLPDGRTVFLLPGNPIACLFAYDLLARRRLRRLGERAEGWPYPRRLVRLSEAIHSKAGRLDYVRILLDPGSDLATPMPQGGAGNLYGAVRADGFCLVPEQVAVCEAGEEVEVNLFDDVR